MPGVLAADQTLPAGVMYPLVDGEDIRDQVSNVLQQAQKRGKTLKVFNGLDTRGA